jgi:hypothetical protein
MAITQSRYLIEHRFSKQHTNYDPDIKGLLNYYKVTGNYKAARRHLFRSFNMKKPQAVGPMAF